MTEERRGRGRLVAVLFVLAAGATGIISSTQPWVIVTLREGTEPLSVAGADAVPVLAPLSLAALALGLVLPLVGRVLRYVFGALAVIIGVALAVLTGQVVFGVPASAYAGAVADATGIAGTDALPGLVAGVETTAWPVVALVGWMLLLVAGVDTLVLGHRWRVGGRRYRAARAASDPGAPLDAIDSWDDLSTGRDPTA